MPIKLNTHIKKYISKKHKDAIGLKKSFDINFQLKDQIKIEESVADVSKSISDYLNFLGLSKNSDQERTVDTIFEFININEELHSEIIRQELTIMHDRWRTTLEVIDLVKVLEPNFQGSKDIEEIYSWIKQTVEATSKKSPHQKPKSKYRQLIYELVEQAKTLRPNERVKEIYTQIDQLLASIYPNLRGSRSIDSIDRAYKDYKKTIK